MSSAQGRLTGLDGLRAIAVTAVFLFHADFMWARGGYLGVDLFFVISGFLITSLLIAEGEAKGRINLGSFYWRRAKRLLPASYMVMTAAIIAAFVWAPDALPRLRWDALASLFYVTNWELLYHGGSYFETMGRQPLLLHLWSLAIEEQFYLIWAPIVFLALPRLGRVPLIALAGAGAIVSAAWMANLGAEMGYPGEGDPTRLYFGTDTHGFPLMIGAFFGLLWRPNYGAARPFLLGTVAAWALGLTALAASLWLMATMGEETPWLYPWGFLASAAASATLILCATYRGAGFGDWLDTQPMRWIGERSYGIYLWHWPIFMVLRPGVDLDLDGWPVQVLRFALTFAAAELSYRFVEMPIRRGALGRAWASWKASGRLSHVLRAGTAVVASLAVVIGLGVGLSQAKEPTLQDALAERLLAGEIVDGATVEVSADASGLIIDGKSVHGRTAPLLRTVGNA